MQLLLQPGLFSDKQVGTSSLSLCFPAAVDIIVVRDCFTCSQTKCVAKEGGSSNNSSGGASKGALAGGIVGALIFLALALLLFLWYRRKVRARAAAAAELEVKEDAPAPAETVLNRPDPTEKPSPPPTELSSVRVYSTSSNTTIDLDPESQRSSHHIPSRGSIPSNPFDDNHSIQTVGTEGTNVIPIALVSPESHHLHSSRSEDGTISTTHSYPVRPERSPDLNLNLEHVAITPDSLHAPANYALSTVSGISGMSRNSFMSGASYSSDFLNEAPMIITPTKGNVRQVLGVVKAEVINAPGSLTSTSNNNDGLKPSSLASRPSVGSPLASTSFGPSDVVKEVDEGQDANPFSDGHSSKAGMSPSASVTTFGQPSPVRSLHDSIWVAEGPNLPWSRSDDASRPSSISTQAGSVIDIGNATRVNVGLNGLGGGYAASSSSLSAGSFSRSPYRTTMGRLVSPSSTGVGTLQEQQQRALAHAQAQAQAQGLDNSRRISGSSVMSAASTRADSILESFPFVPPSPISDRPARSPLAQQSFTSPPASPHSNAPPSPLTQQVFNGNPLHAGDFTTDSDSELPAPPNRRTLGLSTASQLSTASTGLGSFPFQIDTGSSSESGGAPPSTFNGAPSSFNGGRQRASLDTLAITSDLSSYPLGFDRDSAPMPQKR